MAAVQDYIGGEMEKAAQGFEAILEKSPQNDAAWYYLGLCKMKAGDVSRARECLSKAVELDKNNYWYREALLSTYNPYDDLDLTIAQHEKLLQDFPGKTDRQYALANLYISAGNTEKALALLDEIEGRDGKTDASIMTLYGILRRENKLEEAYQALRDYVAEYSSPYILTVLGDYEMGMYNDVPALAYFDEALSLDENYFPAILGKAETYRITRKYPQYFKTLKDIVTNDNASPQSKSDYLVQMLRSTDKRFTTSFKAQLDTVMDLATAKHPGDTAILKTACAYNVYIGETDKAIVLAKKCCDLYPQSTSSAISYLQLLYRGEDWEAVKATCAEMSANFPDADFLIEFDTMAKFRLKDYEGVMENARRMLETAAGDSAKTLSALSTLGDMYHQLGQNKNAYKAYDKALKINPSYAPVLNNYAWYLCTEGKQLKKALKMSRKTIELEPQNSTYLDTYGWILHLTGNTLEAKMFLKQAMLYGGKENYTIMMHYIVVLEKLGEKDMADFYRTQLKSLPKEDE